MPWNDRVREAAYTSPSGTRITFEYEDVRNEIDKKTAGFQFPDADGTFVQDTGHSGRRYPLRVIFWGAEYDLKAEAFDVALLERGVGRLEHPIYGTVNVVPFGTISRRDDLKTAANQTIIDVTFWATIGSAYPSSQTDPASNVLAAVDEYNEAAAGQFEEDIDLDTEGKKENVKGGYDRLLGNVKSGLQKVADTQADVLKQFNAITKSIEEGIDVLIDGPLTLATQTTQLIQAPARALTSIGARLSAYENLANSIISGNGASTSNEFRTADLYASTYVTGGIVSTVNNQFATKAEALGAAELILAQMDAVTDWRDDNLQSLGLIDTGGAYQQLQEAVAITAGFLVGISFSLKQERRIVLDRARTIIDLAAEVYGSVDDQLDILINTNELTGSEILELPKGREIVYYI